MMSLDRSVMMEMEIEMDIAEEPELQWRAQDERSSTSSPYVSSDTVTSSSSNISSDAIHAATSGIDNDVIQTDSVTSNSSDLSQAVTASDISSDVVHTVTPSDDTSDAMQTDAVSEVTTVTVTGDTVRGEPPSSNKDGDQDRSAGDTQTSSTEKGHSLSVHLQRLNAMCRLCGERAVRFLKDRKTTATKCQSLASIIKQFYNVSVSEDRAGVHSSSLCRTCASKVRRLKTRSCSAATLAKQSAEIERVSYLWLCEFDPSLSVSQCVTCVFFEQQKKGGRRAKEKKKCRIPKYKSDCQVGNGISSSSSSVRTELNGVDQTLLPPKKPALRPLSQLQAPLTKAEETYFVKLANIKLSLSGDKRTIQYKTGGHSVLLKKMAESLKAPAQPQVRKSLRKKQAQWTNTARLSLSGHSEQDAAKQHDAEPRTASEKLEPAWPVKEEPQDEPSAVYSTVQPMSDNTSGSLLSLNTSHVCQRCFTTFALFSSLELHMVTFHGETLHDWFLMYSAYACYGDGYHHHGSKAENVDGYHKKAVRKRKEKVRNNNTNGADQEKNRKEHVCDVCSKVFTEAYLLKAHKLVHTGQKQFVCDVCSKVFTRADNLKNHKLIHIGERSFLCDVCGKTFIRAYDLKTHLKLMHACRSKTTCVWSVH